MDVLQLFNHEGCRSKQCVCREAVRALIDCDNTEGEKRVLAYAKLRDAVEQAKHLFENENRFRLVEHDDGHGGIRLRREDTGFVAADNGDRRDRAEGRET